jgi:transcriptional regulator with XRE-family HTH domain
MATPDWDESFATQLSRLRRDVAMTQEQLADRADLSVRAISSLECGDRRPRRYTVERLARALGLSAEQRAVLMATVSRDRRRPREVAVLPTANASREVMVGRGSEINDMRVHLAGAGPPVLAYVGEPGIGKSRLLAEAVAVAADRGIPVLAAAARRDDTGLAPMAEALADQIRRTPSGMLAARLRGCAGLDLLLPELTGQVPGLGVTAPDQIRRLGFAAAVRFVDAIAGDGRLLLVIDDAQWAGADAVDLLTHLVRQARAQIRVVVAYRSAEIVAGSRIGRCIEELARLDLVRTRVLRPLGPADADALVKSEAIGFTEAQRARVVRRAGGVPLFLVELARAGAGDTTADGNVPWHVRLAVGQELTALPRPVVTMLRRMALLATTVGVERLVADDMPAGQVLDCLDVALRFGILDETRRGFRFRYPLVREVLSDGIGPGRRRLRLGELRLDGVALDGVRPGAVLLGGARHGGERHDRPDGAPLDRV